MGRGKLKKLTHPIVGYLPLRFCSKMLWIPSDPVGHLASHLSTYRKSAIGNAHFEVCIKLGANVVQIGVIK